MHSSTLAQHRDAAEHALCQREAALAPWQSRRVTRHVEEHLHAPLSVADLAKLVGLGRSRFSAAFRGSFSQAPHSYLLARRVRRACQWMTMTQEPLSQIAVLCGFADQAHLTRIFRARMGAPPNAWRNAVRSDTGTARSACHDIADPSRPGMTPHPHDLSPVNRGIPQWRPERGAAVRPGNIGLTTAHSSGHGLQHL